MCMRIRNMTQSKLIFVCIFFLYAFAEVLSQTRIKLPGMKYIQMMCLLIIPIKIFLDKKISFKNMPIWICLFALSVVIAFNTGMYFKVISIILFMFAASNIDAKLVIQTSFVALTMVWLMTIVGWALGILPWEVLTTGGRVRYYLGFGYVTFSANIFMHIVIMYIFLKKCAPRIIEWIVIFAINLFLFLLTDTRVVFAEVILLLIIWPLMSKINIQKSKLRYIFSTAFIWCAIVSIVAHVKFSTSSTWMLTLNSLTSSRLYNGYRAFINYGFTAFGQVIEWNGLGKRIEEREYFYVDSSYMNIGINYGVVLLVFLIIGFTYLMILSIKRNDKYSCIALLFLAIHCITDPQLYSLLYDPFLFLLGHRISISNGLSVKDMILSKDSSYTKKRKWHIKIR